MAGSLCSALSNLDSTARLKKLNDAASKNSGDGSTYPIVVVDYSTTGGGAVCEKKTDNKGNETTFCFSQMTRDEHRYLTPDPAAINAIWRAACR